MDTSEIYSKRLNAKEVIFPKKNEKFIFPAADGRIKLSGGDQELRIPTLIRDHSILYLRALQCHSGRNPIDPSQQYNVLIPDNIFEYIYHIGCAINLHSITNSGLIPGGQNLGKERQTLFFAAVNPMDKKHTDPYEIVLLHHVLHGTSRKKRGKDTKTLCIGSKNNLLNVKDPSSIKKNRTQQSFRTHSQFSVSRELL